MAIVLDRPVTVQRIEVQFGGSVTVLDEIKTWARVEDAGSYEDSSGSSVYGLTQRDFTIRYWPPMAAARLADGYQIRDFIITDGDGRTYQAQNLVEIGRRRYHRITASRRLYSVTI